MLFVTTADSLYQRSELSLIRLKTRLYPWGAPGGVFVEDQCVVEAIVRLDCGLVCAVGKYWPLGVADTRPWTGCFWLLISCVCAFLTDIMTPSS